MENWNMTRVWDVKTGLYITVNPIPGTRLVNDTHVGLDGRLYEDVEFEGPLLLHPDLYIQERCTGRKDKCGTLIYKGDLVQILLKWFDEESCCPCEERVVALIVWGEADCAFGVSRAETDGVFRQLKPDDELEIVGNIHENRELLRTDMLTELKKCPFCGHDAQLQDEQSHYVVVCYTCRLYGPDRSGTSVRAKEQAAEEWNSRPLEAALQARIDALQATVDAYRGEE